MKVRLAYSVAIRVDFEILLLDEVLAVGDQDFQEKCFETLEVIRGQGKTIVFVSHDLHAIQEHCERVMHVDHGEIVAIGAPEAVIERYVATVSHM
jgi:lipopolysaccharide transport system ATP-binding protein